MKKYNLKVDFQQQDQQPRQLNTYQPLIRNPFIEVPNNQTLTTQQVEGFFPQQNQQEQWQVSNQQHFNDEQVYGQEQSQFQEHLEQNEYHHLSSPITFGGHQQSEIPLQKSSKQQQQQQSVENNEEKIQEIRPREIDTSRVLINNQLQQQQQPDQKWSLFNLGKRQSKKKHKPSMNTNALESEIKSLTEQDKKDNSQIQSNNEGTKQVQDHLSQPSDEKEYEYQIILQDQSENPEKRLLQTYTYNVSRKNNISKTMDIELLKDYKFNVGVRLINSKTRRTAKNVHPISVKFQVCCSQTPYLPISSEFIKGQRLITLLNGVCTFENLSISDISSRYEGSAFRFVIEATNEKVQKQQVPDEKERGDDNNAGTIGQRTSQRNQLLFKQKIQQAGNQKKEEEDDGEIVDVVIHPSQIKSHIIEKVLVKAWKKE